MPTPSLEFSYRRRHLVLAVLCLSVLLVVMSNMALNVALPTLGRQLHAGVTSLALVVDVYVLRFAGLLLPAGAIGDRYVVRELGGAFGIGVLGSLTLYRYRSRLAPALSPRSAEAADQARAGLAQALGTLGGARGPGGVAARDAYGSGLDPAMIAGAGLVGATALVVHLALPAAGAAAASPDPDKPGSARFPVVRRNGRADRDVGKQAGQRDRADDGISAF
ncbi:MAG TPA: hypothetical protein VH372_05920 [Actinospica sp.]|nr:hypothetical protein [Actinospica sp.]